MSKVRHVKCPHCEQEVQYLVDPEEVFPDTMYARTCALDQHIHRVHPDKHKPMSHPKF